MILIRPWGALMCSGLPLLAAAQAQPIAEEGSAPTRSVGVVTVTGSRPSSLPTQIPTTMESVTRAQIERSVNATDSEDALKYLPSLLVRKRYPGDYNHAILSSRASGTGNSARSLVYADGILLSNLLGNGVGGLSYPPRWGLVTPQEIERVDVMYGPFSAAYPGNSAGAVVDYTTRMPAHFEAHAQLSWQQQPFKMYGTSQTFDTRAASAALGNRAGALAWWLNVERSDSQGQPLTFATRTVAQAAGSGGTPVTGAVPGLNSAGQPWWILGTGTQYRSRQDHLKLKLAYELAPTLRASYVFGWWRNDSDGTPQSYLRDAAGQPVYGGAISIEGRSYAPVLSASDFAYTRERAEHLMHGFSLKRRSGEAWDWELAASLYDYRRDDKRQNSGSNVPPTALAGGTGTLADGHGTGWATLALKATWRPAQAEGRHVVDLGLQHDAYRLRYRTSAIGGNYLADGPGTLAGNVRGDTRLDSAYAQDTWRLSPDWKAVLGARLERWQAFHGLTEFAAPAVPQAHARRDDTFVSPKAALSWQWRDDTVLKASLGRAVRMPTVAELYGATSSANSAFINDPMLSPEKSWTGELSAEHDLPIGSARLTYFAERTRDALYSQTLFDVAANKNISRVQNVGLIRTSGLEAALNTQRWPWTGSELSASVTYADSKIIENAGFVSVPGDTLGKWQPNIPRWRATLLFSQRFQERWSASLGVRHSGRQYRTLNNSDVNGQAYMGVSRYTTVDARVLYRMARAWSVAFGIDNLTNQTYWNFHPYPQRSYQLELRYDL